MNAGERPLSSRADDRQTTESGGQEFEFLDLRSFDTVMDRLRGFRQGLKETGYVEGENVAVDYRFAENSISSMPS